MTECEKYQQFVEDNYMMEFIIWEHTILPNPLFKENNTIDQDWDDTDDN